MTKGYWTGRAGTREGKRPSMREQWRENRRRDDGKPGGCGHYVQYAAEDPRSGGVRRCVNCKRVNPP